MPTTLTTLPWHLAQPMAAAAGPSTSSPSTLGASMNGPDYVQWHGFYEVARIFYSDFLPEAEHLLSGVTSAVKESNYHQWLKGLSAEQRQNIREYYQKRYEQLPQ